MTSKKPHALELRHPIFRPIWRRYALIVVLACWTVVEINYGNLFWALLVGGIGIYAAYVFFWDFTLPDDDSSPEE